MQILHQDKLYYKNFEKMVILFNEKDQFIIFPLKLLSK